jgi:hypothetical protein
MTTPQARLRARVRYLLRKQINRLDKQAQEMAHKKTFTTDDELHLIDLAIIVSKLTKIQRG